MFRVVITDCMPPPALIEEEVLKGVAEVECLEARANEELEGRLADVDGVILYHEVSLTRRLISQLRRCRIIARGGVGYDNIDLIAAREHGIVVTNVPDYGVDEVADHAIGLMLSLRRGIQATRSRLRQNLSPWDRRAVEPLRRLAGQSFGIVGCGRIGTATALRARAFRMEVTFFDPYLAPGVEKALGLHRVHSLEELLAKCDVISLHTPLTEETTGMIDAHALAQMKTDSILINTARGAVVDTTALASVLENGGIAGAGIDVLPVEPARGDDPLVQMWQTHAASDSKLILTPHVAYYSEEGLEEIRRSSAEEVRRVLSGERPRNSVSAESLPV